MMIATAPEAIFIGFLLGAILVVLIPWKTNSRPSTNPKSDCCGASMIPPEEDLEDKGSLWRAYACWICRDCGEPCNPVNINEKQS